MAVGLNSRPKEWSRPPEPHPPDAGCWCSRNKRRPYVSLIWWSTPSGHGNGLRPWIRNNDRRAAHEPVNLPLDCKHAHVSGRSVVRPHLDRRQPRLPAAPGSCRQAGAAARWHPHARLVCLAWEWRREGRPVCRCYGMRIQSTSRTPSWRWLMGTLEGNVATLVILTY